MTNIITIKTNSFSVVTIESTVSSFIPPRYQLTLLSHRDDGKDVYHRQNIINILPHRKVSIIVIVDWYVFFCGDDIETKLSALPIVHQQLPRKW